jgi:hypothetical protein
MELGTLSFQGNNLHGRKKIPEHQPDNVLSNSGRRREAIGKSARRQLTRRQLSILWEGELSYRIRRELEVLIVVDRVSVEDLRRESAIQDPIAGQLL